MRAAVIVFPGSNCDRDMALAFERATGRPTPMVWHQETRLPDGVDVIGVPGGFSYGDYLRCGAIAARSPIMEAVAKHAAEGGVVFGVCNGWQVLVEAGLLPGALLRNRDLTFLCEEVSLRTENHETPFTRACPKGRALKMPVAHHDGAFFCDDEAMRRLEGEGRIAFRYVDAEGRSTTESAPNGSTGAVAGVLSENRRVLGMMPHPERAFDPALGRTDGGFLFQSLAESVLESA